MGQFQEAFQQAFSVQQVVGSNHCLGDGQISGLLYLEQVGSPPETRLLQVKCGTTGG